MATQVKYGPQNEYQEQALENAQNIKSGNSKKSYYDSLFLGTDYEDLYNAILKKYQNQEIPSSMFGYLTGQNQTNFYNHTMSMYDELNALANKMYDEEYQSPASEVARNNAAGLNSDLLGLNGQSAANLSERQHGIPNVKAENPLQVMSNTLQTVMHVYQTIKGFKGINLANEGKEIENLSTLMSFIKPTLVDASAEELKSGHVRAIFNPFGDNRKLSQLFDKALYSLQANDSFSSREKAYERLLGIEKQRWNYGSFIGNPNWSPDDSALFHYVGGMMHEQLASEASKHRFDNNYWSTLSPKLKAEFENSNFSKEKFLNRIRQNMYKSLEYDFNNGSMLAGLLLLGHNPNALHGITWGIENFGLSLGNKK